MGSYLRGRITRVADDNGGVSGAVTVRIKGFDYPITVRPQYVDKPN